MKKYIVILVLTLLGYESIAAEKAPILPRKANNAEYSLPEAKTFVLNYGTVSDWFRSNMLMIINRGLAASGETIKVDDSNMDWIFQHITYEFKDLGPYTNSRLSDGVPEFFQDKDGWSGNIAVFRYGKCVIFLYKTQCMNLLDIPVKPTKPSTVSDPIVVSKSDTVYIETVSAAAQPISITITNTNTNTNTNTVEPSGSTGGTEYYLEDEPRYERRRQVDYREQPIRPTQGRFQVGLQIQSRQRQIVRRPPPRQQETPRGYMGGGRSGVVNQGQMGGGSGNGNNGSQGGGRGD